MDGVIFLVPGIIIAITFFLYDLIQWRKTGQSDSDKCIVIRYKNRFILRLVISMAVLILYVGSLFIYLEDQSDILNLSLAFILLIIMAKFNWKYIITEIGIKNHVDYVVRWSNVKCWRWINKGGDTLLIEHNEGTFKLKVKEKKQNVAEFLERRYNPR